MARKFLYLIAIIIVLVFAALIILRVWSQELTAFVFVPDVEFVEQEPLEQSAYQDPAMWYSRPGIGVNDPARWQPALAEVEAAEDGEETTTSRPVDPQSEELGVRSEVPEFAVFFIHPTSYRETGSWNAPIGDEEAELVADIH